MMEKRGVIQPGITPPEDAKPTGEKTASLEELEDNAVKRMAVKVSGNLYVPARIPAYLKDLKIPEDED